MRGINVLTSRTASAVWQRRLSKTPLRRCTPAVRQLSTTVPVFKQKHLPPPSDPYTSTALSAMLARLSLPASADLHASLMACLTHPTFVTAATDADLEAVEGREAALPNVETNELLSSLGNSLLGLFASEEIAARYPNLPSTALSSAVTSFVGPAALVSVARELGLAVQNEGTAKRNNQVQALPIRWRRRTPEEASLVETPVASRFRESFEDRAKRLDSEWQKRKDGWEEGVASVVRAFVGLIYQEKGLHAARDFVHRYFMTRHVDLANLFKIRKPKHVLSNVVSKHLHDAGVPASSSLGRIESRVIAQSGVHTQAPLFNIGLFLTNGLKLAEGHGSSLAMAEHRAAINALLSLFLVRDDASAARLPTSAHAERPISKTGVADKQGEGAWEGSVSSGASESLHGLGKSIRPART